MTRIHGAPPTVNTRPAAGPSVARAGASDSGVSQPPPLSSVLRSGKKRGARCWRIAVLVCTETGVSGQIVVARAIHTGQDLYNKVRMCFEKGFSSFELCILNHFTFKLKNHFV